MFDRCEMPEAMRRAGVLSTIRVVLCENIRERSELRAKRSQVSRRRTARFMLPVFK
jgi:hypothetical protein